MQDKLDGKNYKLENDIAFPDPDTKGFEKFTPIGSSDTSAFTGILDGNSKKVSKLYIKHDASNVGLFGFVKAPAQTTVVVKNLMLHSPKVTSSQGNVGALVGYLSVGTVKNVHVQGADGTVESTNSSVGGLVGKVDISGVVSSSSSSAQASGKYYVGGLVGSSIGTVTGYATGAVSGNQLGRRARRAKRRHGNGLCDGGGIRQQMGRRARGAKRAWHDNGLCIGLCRSKE